LRKMHITYFLHFKFRLQDKMHFFNQKNPHFCEIRKIGRKNTASNPLCKTLIALCSARATVNQHPPAHHPLDACCGWTSTELIFGFTLVTNSIGNRSHT
jgi:hypothetical protein